MLERTENPPSLALDDFKKINGIGNAMEKRLHTADIHTYAQLGSGRPEELARILDGMVGLSVERIREQDWIGQARRLAEASGQEIEEKPDACKNNSLHYASFNLRLSLTSDNKVHGTRITHVNSEQESSWAGWNQDKLWAFILDREQVDASPRMEAHPKEPLVPETGADHPAAPSDNKAQPSPVSRLSGSYRILSTRLQTLAGHPLGDIIPSQPIIARFLLDLSQLETGGDPVLVYDAQVTLQKMGGGQAFFAISQGPLAAVDPAAIQVDIQPLPPGEYRLKALVTLRAQSQPKHLKYQLPAFSEKLQLCVI
jgi:hypothetical protein